MKMRESIKLGMQGISFLLIAVGVILFLCEVHYGGEVLESIQMSVILNTVSITGLGIILLSVATLLILHYRNDRKYLE